MKTIEDVLSIFRVLTRGSHSPNSASACFMEARSVLTGREWGDRSEDDCPCAQAFARVLNDATWSTPKARTEAMASLLDHPGFARQSDATTQRRAYLAADWACRRFAPIALRAAKLTAQAESLEALAPITDAATCETGHANAVVATGATWAAGGAGAAVAARAAWAALAAVAAAAAVADGDAILRLGVDCLRAILAIKD